MLNIFYKHPIYLKIKEFRSFIGLLFLLAFSIFSITIYDNFKFQQTKHLENFFQNIYLQKTLKSLSESLEPRYEKIIYNIRQGESFEKAFSASSKLVNFPSC